MVFGWEVNDLGRKQSLVQIGHAWPNFFALASLYIIFEHVRKAVLEFQCDALAHYSDAIHGIDQSLSLRLQNICDQNLHKRLPEEHITPYAHWLVSYTTTH